MLVETPQRTRVDAVGDVLQVVTHRLSMGASGRVISEQVGVVLMPNLVLNVEEVPRRMAFPEFTEWLVKLPESPDRAQLDDIFFFLLDEVLDEVLPLLKTLLRNWISSRMRRCDGPRRGCCDRPATFARICAGFEPWCGPCAAS